jgi:rubrerythrin
MRLIDADALIKFLGVVEDWRDEAINKIISNYPTVGAAPVVRGEWIEHEDEMECPQCGYFWNYCDNDTERFNYCPNCGAKMEDKP